MSVDWRGGLAFPFRGRERERPFVALWVLYLLATVPAFFPFVPLLWLLVSLFAILVAVGYLVRLLVASERGDPAPPLLSEPVRTLHRGVGGFAISLVYLAVPFLLLLITVYGALWSEPIADPNAFSGLTIYAGSTAVLSLSMIGAYLLPVALATYGARESIRSAFSPGALRAVATHAAYFAGWTAAAGVSGFAAAVAVGLASAHAVGPVLATGLLAYLSLFTAHVWGRALARAR